MGRHRGQLIPACTSNHIAMHNLYPNESWPPVTTILDRATGDVATFKVIALLEY